MRGISDYSFLFNNYGNNKNTNIFSSFNFADYEAIKNGSYLKLAKKQFANIKESDTTSTNKKDNTKTSLEAQLRNKIKSSVDTHRQSVDALNNKDLWKQTNGSYDTEGITKAVKAFAASYNGIVDQVKESTSSAVASSAGWMYSLTNTMKTSLEKVGIDLDENNKLTVDEAVLSKADMKSVKAMFSGAYSYASQTTEKASSIVSASLRDVSLYTNKGSYANVMSSWFDTSI